MEENKAPQETRKNGLFLPIVVLIVIVGGFVFVNRQNLNKTEKKQSIATVSQTVTNDENGAPSPIAVEGGMFYFKPNEIRVKKGETVKIIFTNVDGKHDFVLDEFNIKTAELEANESESFEFVADKQGVFEFYCSVSDHRAMGMLGKLIVEE